MELAKRVDDLWFADTQYLEDKLVKGPRGGLGPGLVNTFGRNRWEVRLSLGRTQHVIGVTSSLAKAARFSDMAKVFFWPYRSQKARALVNEDYNISLEDAQYHLDNHAAAAALLEEMRRLFASRYLIASTPDGEITAGVIMTRCKAMRGEICKFKPALKKLINLGKEGMEVHASAVWDAKHVLGLLEEADGVTKHLLELLTTSPVILGAISPEQAAEKDRELARLQQELAATKRDRDQRILESEELERLRAEREAFHAKEAEQHLATSIAEGRPPVDLFSPQAIKDFTAEINARLEAENKKLDNSAGAA